MTEISRLMRVRELPDSLRVEAVDNGLDTDSIVQITVKHPAPARQGKTRDDLLMMLMEVGQTGRTDETIADAIERVDELRDEWDR